MPGADGSGGIDNGAREVAALEAERAAKLEAIVTEAISSDGWTGDFRKNDKKRREHVLAYIEAIKAGAKDPNVPKAAFRGSRKSPVFKDPSTAERFNAFLRRIDEVLVGVSDTASTSTGDIAVHASADTDTDKPTGVAPVDAKPADGAEKKTEPSPEFKALQKEFNRAIDGYAKKDAAFASAPHRKSLVEYWLRAKRSQLQPNEHPYFDRWVADKAAFSAFADSVDDLDRRRIVAHGKWHEDFGQGKMAGRMFETAVEQELVQARGKALDALARLNPALAGDAAKHEKIKPLVELLIVEKRAATDDEAKTLVADAAQLGVTHDLISELVGIETERARASAAFAEVRGRGKKQRKVKIDAAVDAASTADASVDAASANASSGDDTSAVDAATGVADTGDAKPTVDAVEVKLELSAQEIGANPDFWNKTWFKVTPSEERQKVVDAAVERFRNVVSGLESEEAVLASLPTTKKAMSDLAAALRRLAEALPPVGASVAVGTTGDASVSADLPVGDAPGAADAVASVDAPTSVDTASPLKTFEEIGAEILADVAKAATMGDIERLIERCRDLRTRGESEAQLARLEQAIDNQWRELVTDAVAEAVYRPLLDAATTPEQARALLPVIDALRLEWNFADGYKDKLILDIELQAVAIEARDRGRASMPAGDTSPDAIAHDAGSVESEEEKQQRLVASIEETIAKVTDPAALGEILNQIDDYVSLNMLNRAQANALDKKIREREEALKAETDKLSSGGEAKAEPEEEKRPGLWARFKGLFGGKKTADELAELGGRVFTGKMTAAERAGTMDADALRRKAETEVLLGLSSVFGLKVFSDATRLWFAEQEYRAVGQEYAKGIEEAKAMIEKSERMTDAKKAELLARIDEIEAERLDSFGDADDQYHAMIAQAVSVALRRGELAASTGKEMINTAFVVGLPAYGLGRAAVLLTGRLSERAVGVAGQAVLKGERVGVKAAYGQAIGQGLKSWWRQLTGKTTPAWKDATNKERILKVVLGGAAAFGAAKYVGIGGMEVLNRAIDAGLIDSALLGLEDEVSSVDTTDVPDTLPNNTPDVAPQAEPPEADGAPEVEPTDAEIEAGPGSVAVAPEDVTYEMAASSQALDMGAEGKSVLTDLAAIKEQATIQAGDGFTSVLARQIEASGADTLKEMGFEGDADNEAAVELFAVKKAFQIAQETGHADEWLTEESIGKSLVLAEKAEGQYGVAFVDFDHPDSPVEMDKMVMEPREPVAVTSVEAPEPAVTSAGSSGADAEFSEGDPDVAIQAPWGELPPTAPSTTSETIWGTTTETGEPLWGTTVRPPESSEELARAHEAVELVVGGRVVTPPDGAYDAQEMEKLATHATTADKVLKAERAIHQELKDYLSEKGVSERHGERRAFERMLGRMEDQQTRTLGKFLRQMEAGNQTLIGDSRPLLSLESGGMVNRVAFAAIDQYRSNSGVRLPQMSEEEWGQFRDQYLEKHGK